MASQVYFEDADGVGDVYYAIADTLPGESPATHPEKWALILIPARARSYLTLAAAATLRRSNGEMDSFALLTGQARDELKETTRLAAREKVPFTMPVRVP